MPNTLPSASAPDGMTVTDALAHFKLGRTQLYERFKVLQIQTESVNGRSRISGKQVAMIEQLNELMRQQPMQLAAYIVLNDVDVPEPEPTPMDIVAQFLQVMQAQAAAPQLPAVPLEQKPESSPLETLPAIAESGSLVPTTKIAQLLGIKTNSISKRGKVWLDWGYRFTRQGKCGREAGWLVQKVNYGKGE
jgi:hypothetical protein